MPTRASAALACRELVELMTDYLEGALAPAERVRSEHHLAHCSGCKLYLHQVRATIRACGSLEAPLLTEDAKRSLLTVFLGWRGCQVR